MSTAQGRRPHIPYRRLVAAGLIDGPTSPAEYRPLERRLRYFVRTSR